MAGGTWIWIGNVGSADISSNWTLEAGSSNAQLRPGPGDTAVINDGQAIYLDPNFINSSTVVLNASGGVALLSDGTVASSATIDASSTILADGTATAMQIGGPVSNGGTIELTGTNDSLTIAIAANGSIAGLLSNAGEISVGASDTLTVTGPGDFLNTSSFIVNGGSALIASPLTGTGAWLVSGGGTLEFDQPNSGANAFVDLSAGTGTVKLDNASLFQGSINGFVTGDRVDLGAVTVATAIYNGSGQLQLLASDNSVLFQGNVIGANGTLFPTGTFAIGTTGGIAGGLRIAQGPDSDAILLVQGPSTWTWFGGTGSAASSGNWSLTSGPGNFAGLPGPSDTSLVNTGTLLATDMPLVASTVVIGNATARFSNDTTLLQAASFDTTTTIECTASAAASVLQSSGLLLNNGTIAGAAANGSFALQVGQSASDRFVNNGEIVASNGDALTISGNGGASFVNVGTVLAQGGLVHAIGPVAPGNGIWSVGKSGTLEIGVLPDTATVLFADQMGTLKLDAPSGEDARILGFQTGDTIDLGHVSVDSVVYDDTDSTLMLIDAGNTVGSLSLVSNAFQSGSFAVSGGTAGSFAFSTNGAGETLLTTSAQNTSWGTNEGSGDWSTAPNWTHGEPGSNATAVFGPSASSRTITVDNAISAGSVLLDDANTTINVSFELTLARDIDDLAGSVVVSTGGMLIAQSLREDGAANGIGFSMTSSSSTAVLTGATDPANAGAGPIAIIDSTTVVMNGGLLDAGGQTTAGATGGYIGIGENVGGDASAAMTVQSAGTVFATYTRLGSGLLSGGTLTITGDSHYTNVGDAADSANTRGDMLVGTGGGTLGSSNLALLTLDTSGTLTETSYAQIAVAIGSRGSVSVSNGAQWNIGIRNGQPGFLAVGEAGTGSLTINGGNVDVGAGGTILVSGASVAVPYAVDIGVSTGAAGTVSVTGFGSLIGNADIRVGDAGVGTLLVGGGDVHAISGNLDVGGGVAGTDGGVGVVNLSAKGSIGVDDNLFVWQGSTVSVDPTSVLGIGGSGTINGQINLDPNHALTGDGVVQASIIDNGSIVASAGGTLEITGSVTGIGGFTIGPSTSLRLDVAPQAVVPVTFATGAPGGLILESPGTSFANNILNLADGDTITLAGLNVASASVTGGGTVTVNEVGGGTYLLTDVGFASGASQSFITGSDFIQVACFLAGTRIATAHGDRPVESLREGDHVWSVLRGENEKVDWIGLRRIDCTRHPRPKLVWPVRILAGALGQGLPRRDLYLSPDHALYLDGVLIPVKYLINGSSVAQIVTDEVTYYHVGLPHHGVLLAEGAASESHLDIGDRASFDSGGAVVALYPDFVANVWEADGCAPLVISGPLLEAARRNVNSVAAVERAA